MRLLGVHEEERRDAWAAFVALFGLIASHAVLETARDALFLASVPATELPWVFIGTAAMSLGAMKLQWRLGGAADERRVLSAWLLGVGAVTLAFVWLHQALGRAGLYALYIWSGAATALVLAHFWTLLGSLFSVTQAKRLYAFIGAGSALGGIAGTAAAGALSRVMPADRLLLLAGGGFIVTALVPQWLTRAPPLKLESTAPRLVERLSYVVQTRYAARVVLVALVSALCLTLLDYLFKSVVAARVPAAELGTFLGSVYFVLNVTSLIVQLVLVRRLLARFSVTAVLSLLPILLVAGGALAAVSGALLAFVALKGVDGALRYSVHRTAAELLLLPFSEYARRRMKPIMEGLGQRGGQVLASAGILALGMFRPRPEMLAVLLALLAAVWVAAVIALHRPYLEMFRTRLRAGRVAHLDEFPELDVASLETLVASLDSPRDGEVLAALTLLEREQKTHLIPGLIVFHPSDAVVERALAIFAASGRTSAASLIGRVLDHPSARIRSAAASAHAVLASDTGPLRARLEVETAPEVRAALNVNLTVSGALDLEAASGAIEELIERGDVVTRVALARALARPGSAFSGALIALATATEPEVRLAAVSGMRALRLPSFLPALIERLGEEATRPEAQQALLEFGDAGLSALLSALRAVDTPAPRWRIPDAISRFDAALAAAGLLDWLPNEPDGSVRYRILCALERIARRNPGLRLERARLKQVIEQTLSQAYRHLDCRLALERGAVEVPDRRTAGHDLLRQLLFDKTAHATERVFRLLGLLHPDDDFAAMHRGLGGSKDRRATSLELVSNVLREPVRSAVLGLVEELTDAERLSRGARYHAPLGLDYSGVLQDMLENGTASMQDIAVFHIGELGLVGFAERVARLPNPDGARRDLTRTLGLLGGGSHELVPA